MLKPQDSRIALKSHKTLHLMRIMPPCGRRKSARVRQSCEDVEYLPASPIPWHNPPSATGPPGIRDVIWSHSPPVLSLTGRMCQESLLPLPSLSWELCIRPLGLSTLIPKVCQCVPKYLQRASQKDIWRVTENDFFPIWVKEIPNPAKTYVICFAKVHSFLNQ